MIRKPKRVDLNSEKSIPAVYEEGPTELNERIATEKRSLNGFFQLFGSVEARTHSFVEDVAKARSFKYQKKPNDDGCHLCMYTLIASATLLSVVIAFGICFLFRRN